jgi:AraC-like DNA-binding protein
MLAFVQLLGTLVANLFRSQQLEVENHLLGRSTLSLTEVASMCGLADAEYLERAFTRSVGVYPLLWNPKERSGFNGAHGRSAAGAVTAHLRTDPAYPDISSLPDRHTRSPKMLSCVVPFSRKRSPACFAQLL